MAAQRVPILVYHHIYPDAMIGDSGAGVIGESDFRHHMKYLAQEHWQVISMSDIVDWLGGDGSLPERAVAIHLDNGWLDTRTVALPIMQEFGVTGICYVITDGLEAASTGKSKAVRTMTEGVVEKPFMNWDQARQLIDAGWEIGAHTATHCKLADKHTAEGDGAVRWEIESSNTLIEERVGRAPIHFAYPSGSRSMRTDELLTPYYRSLRRWNTECPVPWRFTDHQTSHLAVECQNVDLRLPFGDFKRIFDDALR